MPEKQPLQPMVKPAVDVARGTTSKLCVFLGKGESRDILRVYILRFCKYFGYPKEQLTKLFEVLIMSLFLYGIEIWGAAYQGKYLNRIVLSERLDLVTLTTCMQ